MGHIFSEEGVSVDHAKISSIHEWHLPKSLGELCGFLGLTGYYQKFVEGYGKIKWSLTEQLKKDNFNWTEEATKSFRQMQTVMTRVSVLDLPNFEKEFIVDTDASGYSLGVILTQEGRPLAFFSHWELEPDSNLCTNIGS